MPYPCHCKPVNTCYPFNLAILLIWENSWNLMDVDIFGVILEIYHHSRFSGHGLFTTSMSSKISCICHIHIIVKLHVCEYGFGCKFVNFFGYELNGFGLNIFIDFQTSNTLL